MPTPDVIELDSFSLHEDHDALGPQWTAYFGGIQDSGFVEAFNVQLVMN
jgi:hypothetical protein